MANQEHLRILKQGVEVWNAWRRQNPHVEPELGLANLRQAVLREANLSGADLIGTDLRGAHLDGRTSA